MAPKLLSNKWVEPLLHGTLFVDYLSSQAPTLEFFILTGFKLDEMKEGAAKERDSS